MPSVSKTAASASPQTEKPTHYTYLKEFRTEQCPLFLQHKCTQHRPFTCFHWHFLNQRRRRPIRRRDGTFNYSPDVYCTKYDETTGICPDGDDCPYLHRTTGDTERKYHLRYYKTGTCIHETDTRGHCVKNGLHCAFAHGPHDLRPPVYDIREIQAQEALQNGQLGAGEGIPDLQPGVLASQAMIEKTLTEDPRWQDTNFVLANYKTDQCTKPPRLCRQGYACPHFHNSRDPPEKPAQVQVQIDSVSQQQQFHPEIYKSTKCNDMRQTGYCPRGPFCAFAHVERIPSSEESVNSLLTVMHTGVPGQAGRPAVLRLSHRRNGGKHKRHPPAPQATTAKQGSVSCSSSPNVTSSSGSNSSLSPVGPIGRPKSLTNAPGFEREDQAKTLKGYPVDGNQKLADQDKQALISVFAASHPLASSITSSITSSLASSMCSDSSSPTALSTMNVKATPFYPGSNTVESVIGSALDLNFRDINVASLDKELEEQENNGIGLTSQRLLGGSAPVNIPGSLPHSSSLQSSSLSASPLGSLSQSILSGMTPQPCQPQAPPTKPEHGLLGTSTSSQNSLGLNGGSGSIWDFVSGSFSPGPSPAFGAVSSPAVGSGSADLPRLLRELDEAKRKIKQWEDAWQQVKQACDAWQKDARDAKEQAKCADGERQLAVQKREDAERKLKELQEDFDTLCRSPGVPLLRSYGELDQLPLPKLHTIQSQLRTDLDLVDGVIYQLQSKKCIVCQKHDRSVVLQPCQHYVLCENCAPSKTECPYCKTKILKW
ncbi:hypothetical protein SKAU_G00288250 [Synaphobranchus kaupii]|uniref:E3 ubiquitin-protein ligase UNKL n=1 Tax=Synaphobranchus kaupii TaxID=118154 RepID=A0A9Q1ET71_SYNKA|nr:hypothetical protein SKAU_G00288250 [Synaphobranchus kaupii]